MDNKELSIYLLSGTHWDREWYQTFQGFRARLVKMMNELIELLENDPEFRVFHLDGQTIVMEDYLEIEPDNRQRLEKLIKDGRIVIGPWYVMPDEFLLSGESLIRNLMMGHQISEKWGVEAWKYGYICDIFGHISQMPQIFKGFDISYALLGRGTNEHTTPSHFIWKAMDNSECITFKLKDSNGYGAFRAEVIGCQDEEYKDINTLPPKIKNHVDYEITRSDIPVVLLADALDHMEAHKDTSTFLKMTKDLYPDAKVCHVNLEEMGKNLEKYKDMMPIKQGELYEPAKQKGGFVYVITHTLSSRYPIKQANDICQTLLENWVEPITAIATLRGKRIQKSYTDMAYKHLIQNHPHDSICGCSIDQVHKDMEYRFDQVKMISNQVIDECMDFDRSLHIIDNKSNERALVLWNILPFARSEVITVDIDFNTDYPTKFQEPFGYELKNSFKILDHNNNEIPYGLVSMKKNYTVRRFNQFTEVVDVHKVSFEVNLPAMGSVEYKIVPFDDCLRYLNCLSKNENGAENEFVKLTIKDNGTINLYDKITSKSYDNLLSYLDDGEIGDGWYHVNPADDRLISSIGCKSTIERIENGPSRAAFKVIKYMDIPAEMDYYTHGIMRSKSIETLEIVSYIGLSKGSRSVDVETVVNNTATDHRLRLKIPTNINSDSYFVNQPFAFVERNTGINLETQTWKECDVPEKQTGGIVLKRDADSNGLAFISAYGIHECAAPNDNEGSMIITLFRSFKKTVMTNGEVGGQILGELKFKYCIYPVNKNTTYANLIRVQNSIQAGIKSMSFGVSKEYTLPQPASYFDLRSENICMSILKRSEKDEKRIIIRLYNMSCETSTANLNCFRNIHEVFEVNMNEEYIGKIKNEDNEFTVSLDGWKVKTYCLCFERGA